MDFLKTILSLLAGYLVASGSELFGKSEFIAQFGVSPGRQLFAGLVLFIMAMIIHIAGGGSLLPRSDR